MAKKKRKFRRRPVHRTTLHFPGGGVQVFEARPTRRLKIRAYCKYCYTRHGDWWQMRREDYGADVVLCGRCEYTTARDCLEK
jgi:hypothetical protein